MFFRQVTDLLNTYHGLKTKREAWPAGRRAKKARRQVIGGMDAIAASRAGILRWM